MFNSKFIWRAFSVAVIGILLFSHFSSPLSTLMDPVTAASGDWWNNDWTYRRAVTIQHTQVIDNQEGFPVLVDFTLGDPSKAQTDGGDFVFTDINGAKLSHEVESYDSSSGHLVAWVEVPTLSSSSDTALYVYYGNSDSADQEDPAAVWDSNFMEIHHMDGSSYSALDDSTGSNNDVVGATGTPNYNVNCKIGKGVEFVPNEGLTINDAPTLDGYSSAATFEAWVASDNYALANQGIMAKWSTGSKSWFVQLSYTSPNKKVLFYFSQDGLTNKYASIIYAFQDSSWYHIAVVWKASAVPSFYINGVKQTTLGSLTSTSIYAGTATQYVGRRGTYYFDGKIDECRVSNVERSASWIQTCFNNQNNPSAFCTIGIEETGETPPPSDDPRLVSSGGTDSTHEYLTCYNQTTENPDGGQVSNIYNWYKDDVSLANMLLPFDTNSPTTAKDYSGHGNGGSVNGATWTSSGIVGGAYDFDGINDRIVVSDSESLGGEGTWLDLTIEFWVKTDAPLHGTRLLGKKNQTASDGSYMVGFQTSMAEPANTLFFGITTTFFDNFVEPTWCEVVVPPPGLDVGVWHHIVCTYKSGPGLAVYINGELRASSAMRGTIYSETPTIGDEPLFIGYNGQSRWLNGSLDEVAIYNRVLTSEQVHQRYVDSKDGLSTSSTIVPQETSDVEMETWKCAVTPNDGIHDYTTRVTNSLTVKIYEPIISDETPSNGSFQVSSSLSQLSFVLRDYQGDLLDYYVTTSPDIGHTSRSNVAGGTRYYVSVSGVKASILYEWHVDVTDGTHWTNKTFKFTTPWLQRKWTRTGLSGGFSGVLIGDVEGDGDLEVIQAGVSSINCLNANTGALIWSHNDADLGDYCQPEMADLNNDGILEIVAALQGPLNNPGCIALHGDDGSTYWRLTGLGGSSITSKPVIADIDGSGYPTIFIGSEDITEPYDGKVTAISYDGHIVRQTWVYRPCSGGFSIADVNNDGRFELFMGDRSGSGVYTGGRGVNAFDAHTLEVLWTRPDILCSSHCPLLVDVDGDGVLEVVVENQRGGVFVLNSANGETIRGSTNVNMPGHYQPSIHDVDGDGNLEMMFADGTHGYGDIAIWDLVDWQEDARFSNAGLCVYAPQLADITGDGTMEIIACNFTAVFVYAYNGVLGTYETIDVIAGFSGWLTYAVAQDIDDDGKNELVIQSSGGSVYALDTPAPAPNPRARTEVHFYSERRLGAAEYVPLHDEQPFVLDTYPFDKSTNVPATISELSFTLKDFQGDSMDYSVTTSPNVGSDSDTHVHNGRFALSLGDLEPRTTYTWRVDVTDGTHSARETFSFTTRALDSWWNTDWSYRKAIAINPAKDSQTNFPVLVDFTLSNTAKAQSDGGDFVFVDTSGTKLPHEIERYDSATGQLKAWVRVPALSSTSYTVIYLYYGNSDVANQENPAATWDTDFMEVHHLDGASYSALDDSTGNNNDVTGATGTPNYNVNCKIGRGVEFVPNEGLTISDDSTLDGYTDAATFEAWVASDNYKLASQVIMAKWSGGKSWFIQLQYVAPYSRVVFYFTEDGATAKYVFCTYTFQDGNWYHIAVVWKDGTVPSFYINGMKQATQGSSTTSSIYAGAATEQIGTRGMSYFDGKIDECRISNVERSASWIQASFNNQNDPSTFYTVGKEETIA